MDWNKDDVSGWSDMYDVCLSVNCCFSELAL